MITSYADLEKFLETLTTETNVSQILKRIIAESFSYPGSDTEFSSLVSGINILAQNIDKENNDDIMKKLEHQFGIIKAAKPDWVFAKFLDTVCLKNSAPHYYAFGVEECMKINKNPNIVIYQNCFKELQRKPILDSEVTYEVIITKAREHFDNGNFRGVIKHLEEREAPNKSLKYVIPRLSLLGNSHYALEEYKEAKKYYLDILKYDEPEGYLIKVAYCFYKEKNYQDALGYLDKVQFVQKKPECRILYTLCLFYSLQKYPGAGVPFEEMVSTLRKLVKETNGSAEAYNALGLIYYENKKYDEALTNFKHAWLKNKGNHQYRFNLFKVYWESGDIPIALDHLDGAIQLFPRDTIQLNEYLKTFPDKKDVKNFIVQALTFEKYIDNNLLKFISIYVKSNFADEVQIIKDLDSYQTRLKQADNSKIPFYSLDDIIEQNDMALVRDLFEKGLYFDIWKKDKRFPDLIKAVVELYDDEKLNSLENHEFYTLCYSIKYPLHHAAICYDEINFKRTLKLHIDKLNTLDSEGASVLEHACSWSIPVLKVLVKNGSELNINMYNSEGESALYTSISNTSINDNSKEAVRILLLNGALYGMEEDECLDYVVADAKNDHARAMQTKDREQLEKAQRRFESVGQMVELIKSTLIELEERKKTEPVVQQEAPKKKEPTEYFDGFQNDYTEERRTHPREKQKKPVEKKQRPRAPEKAPDQDKPTSASSNGHKPKQQSKEAYTTTSTTKSYLLPPLASSANINWSARYAKEEHKKNVKKASKEIFALEKFDEDEINAIIRKHLGKECDLPQLQPEKSIAEQQQQQQQIVVDPRLLTAEANLRVLRNSNIDPELKNIMLLHLCASTNRLIAYKYNGDKRAEFFGHIQAHTQYKIIDKEYNAAKILCWVDITLKHISYAKRTLSNTILLEEDKDTSDCREDVSKYHQDITFYLGLFEKSKNLQPKALAQEALLTNIGEAYSNLYRDTLWKDVPKLAQKAIKYRNQTLHPNDSTNQVVDVENLLNAIKTSLQPSYAVNSSKAASAGVGGGSKKV
jgi:tetratricopeptide (TPR) repeat protein